MHQRVCVFIIVQKQHYFTCIDLVEGTFQFMENSSGLNITSRRYFNNFTQIIKADY